jgi:YegS/Rv2252/BmrU family lipid kinase
MTSRRQKLLFISYTTSMPPKKPIELLINVRSRRGRDQYDTVVAACKAAGLVIDRIHTASDTASLSKVLRDITARSPGLLIVASGDGTISKVVDFLAGSSIQLGVIPLGTTNNFARSLGLPFDVVGAVQRIARNTVRTIDLGKIGDDYFANVAGIGISAEIAQAVTPGLKHRFGRLAYALTGIKVLFTHKPFLVQVADKDGELRLHFETHQVIVANGAFHAGKIIASDAALDSRELVIFKLGGASRLNFIWHMIDFYVGRRRSIRHSAYLMAKDVIIKTNVPQPIELDGEVKASTPTPVKVSPRAILVRC